MFKPGDKIRCIREEFGNETLGKEYIFKRYCSFFNKKGLTIEEDDTGHLNSYYLDQFEPAYIQEFNNKLESIIND